MFARKFIPVFLFSFALSVNVIEAHAEPRLALNAPLGCPSEDFLNDLLLRHIDRETRATENRIVRMNITFETESTYPYEIEISIQGPEFSGVRRLRGEDCGTLAEAGVVIAALALGPLAPDPSEGSDSPEQDQPDQPDLPEQPPDPVPEEPLPERFFLDPPSVDRPSEGSRGLHLEAFILGRLTVGAFPSTTGGFSLGLSLTWNRFRGEIAYAFLPRSVGYVEGSSGPGGEFSMMSGDIRACGDVFDRIFQITLCGGIELGQINANGFGVQRTNNASVLWVSPEISTIVAWKFSRYASLRFDAALQIPLNRPLYYIDLVGNIYQSSVVSGRFGLGFGFHFF